MFKKIILVLLVIALLGGAYGYFFMYNKAHPDYENLEAEITITAAELFSECKNGNALKYTGKLLEVAGNPQSLEINDSLYSLVFVFDEGMFGAEGVRATLLPQYHQKIEEIQLPHKMTIKAYCTGYNDTDVILEKSSIINY